MDIVGPIINIVLAVAAIVSAIVAVVQARVAVRARQDAKSAQSGAELAQRETVELARKANDAFDRQALAQEKANELAQAALPKDEVRWEYEHISGVIYVLQNTGTKVARQASMSDTGEPVGFVRPDDTSPRDVSPGDSLEFKVITAFGAPRPQFRITWTEDGSDQKFSDDTRMVIR